MRGKRSIRQIIRENKRLWDNDTFDENTRRTFNSLLKCGTSELGAKVYGSINGTHRYVYFTCKEKLCPSCGRIRTLHLIEQVNARLPDTSYASVLLTMSNSLWKIFRNNKSLLTDLPGIAAGVLQDWAISRYNAEILVLPVTHTFGGDLKFSPHLHVLVSTTGLRTSTEKLIQNISFPLDHVVREWRHRLIDYLRVALSHSLISGQSNEELCIAFDREYDLYWRGGVDPSIRKEDMIKYFMRYVSRPPVAERNVLHFNRHLITLRLKNTREKSRENQDLQIVNFLRRLEDHHSIPYSHAARYFGLISPRSVAHFKIFCALLGHRYAPPRKLLWRDRMIKTFGPDPLLDTKGQQMVYLRTILPPR
jgi:hypothetical protein